MSCATRRACSPSSATGSTTTTARRLIQRSACGARPSTGRASNSRPHLSREFGEQITCGKPRKQPAELLPLLTLTVNLMRHAALRSKSRLGELGHAPPRPALGPPSAPQSDAVLDSALGLHAE